ncbi:MAG: ABC transporter permease, partial [Gemmatimonadota bacterium]
RAPDRALSDVAVGRPPSDALDGALRDVADGGPPRRVSFDTDALAGWDSTLLAFLRDVLERCDEHGVEVDRSGLPGGVRRLLDLAEAVPEREDAGRERPSPPIVDRIGRITIETGRSAAEGVEFIGATTVGLGRLLRGRARFRGVDLAILVQQAGAEALPIVTLVSFLLGLILAFVAAVQLEQFGATIYVANLVGIAMLRDVGALITGIVMAGRSGAAYAAQLASMKVTQEIDALATMGISPVEYLVLPRILALCAMMPLLALYSDLLGIIGGLAIGTGMLDLSFHSYVQQTIDAVDIGDLAGGVFKAAVYGVLIAVAGCLRGMQADRSSAGVGDATTSAVVTGIVAIIAACGVFQFVFYLLEW